MLTRLPSGGAADTMAPVGLFQIWNKSDRMFDENSLPGRNHNSMIQALKQWNGDWLRQNIWRCVFYFKRCAFHTNRCMLHLHVCRGEGGNRDARAVSMTNRRIDWKCQGTMKKKHTRNRALHPSLIVTDQMFVPGGNIPNMRWTGNGEELGISEIFIERRCTWCIISNQDVTV